MNDSIDTPQPDTHDRGVQDALEAIQTEAERMVNNQQTVLLQTINAHLKLIAVRAWRQEALALAQVWLFGSQALHPETPLAARLKDPALCDEMVQLGRELFQSAMRMTQEPTWGVPVQDPPPSQPEPHPGSPPPGQEPRLHMGLYL